MNDVYIVTVNNMELESVEVYFWYNGEWQRVVNYFDTDWLVYWQKKMITTEELDKIENTVYTKVDELLSNYI